MTHDLRTSITEPQTLQRIHWACMGWNLPEQLAGSSSRRLEADAAVAVEVGAAVEVGTIREQKP